MHNFLHMSHNRSHKLTESCRTCEQVFILSRYPVKKILQLTDVNTGERIYLSQKSNPESERYGVYVIEGNCERNILVTYWAC